jgi:hypothetical protein
MSLVGQRAKRDSAGAAIAAGAYSKSDEVHEVNAVN